MNPTLPATLNPSTLDWRLIAGGLAVGLFGWVIYWAGLWAVGALIGAAAGGALGFFVSEFIQAPWALPLFGGVGLVLGLVLGVMFMKTIQIYFFFASGATIGATLAWRAIHQPPLLDYTASTPPWGILLIVIGGALVGGLVLVYFRRFMIAVITSLIGTVLLMAGLPEAYRLLGGLIGFCVFIAVQVGLVRRFVDAEAFDGRLRRRREAEWRDARPDIESEDDDER